MLISLCQKSRNMSSNTKLHEFTILVLVCKKEVTNDHIHEWTKYKIQ